MGILQVQFLLGSTFSPQTKRSVSQEPSMKSFITLPIQKPLLILLEPFAHPFNSSVPPALLQGPFASATKNICPQQAGRFQMNMLFEHVSQNVDFQTVEPCPRSQQHGDPIDMDTITRLIRKKLIQLEMGSLSIIAAAVDIFASHRT